ncbi:hypothetical protein GCM10009798_19820 [Nocardioides panacihumi]|uniref:Uncharacterized protein n=1 Tax=Nocardioides panacihumi TaxID=400774 RepID=A0ABP5CCU4_9ACTN
MTDGDTALDIARFDRGCLVLRRDGQVMGHVATSLGHFRSLANPLRKQPWVWLVVVWSDGRRERSVEDYPPWTYVREMHAGKFVWLGAPDVGRDGEYDVEFLPEAERDRMWAELGITATDF